MSGWALLRNGAAESPDYMHQGRWGYISVDDNTINVLVSGDAGEGVSFGPSGPWDVGESIGFMQDVIGILYADQGYSVGTFDVTETQPTGVDQILEVTF